AFERREKVLFFPDQHLGRNTAYKLGIPLDEMAVWDYDKPMGGLTAEQIRKAKVLLWKGFCSVHQMFQPEHIDRFKEKYPDAKIIAHPECSFEVCEKSDYVGSTEYIQNHLRNAEPGTRWLVGTELNLVNRLHNEMKDKGVHVHFMSPMVCMCSTMFRIDPQHLCWTLENLVEGRVVNRISVPADVAMNARIALDRMLAIGKQGDVCGRRARPRSLDERQRIVPAAPSFGSRRLSRASLPVFHGERERRGKCGETVRVCLEARCLHPSFRRIFPWRRGHNAHARATPRVAPA